MRVCCEDSTPCRVFLECWDAAGARGFDEFGGGIDAGRTEVCKSETIEDIVKLRPTTRLSCRVLSKGTVTAQNLARDGSMGVLVNNTYVGDDPAH